jgi:mannose-6-phosphate isomerase-like protein (cupin superfamily)
MHRVLRACLAALGLLLACAAPTLARVSSEVRLAPCTSAQSASKTLGEKSISQLPSGPLTFQLERFPDLTAAQAAAGPLGVAAEAGSAAWLLTLGPVGRSGAGGTRVTELGPLSVPSAAGYTLRLQQRVSQPGCEGDAHTHPGAEAWYLLSGEQTIISASGQSRFVAGQGMVGPAPGAPMQLAYTGSAMTDALTFLILDSGQPASTPATVAPTTMPVAGGGYGERVRAYRQLASALALVLILGGLTAFVLRRASTRS